MTATAPLPPQSLEAEEYVLGAMLISTRVIEDIAELLVANDFYRPSHAHIYRAILELYAAGQPADFLTVTDKLTEMGKIGEAGGPERIDELAAIVPASGNALHHANLVRKAAVRRAMTTVGHRIAQIGFGGEGETADALEEVERLVFELTQTRRSEDFVSIRETVADAFTQIQKVYENGRDVIGVPAGFTALDRLTSGFQPGNLIIIAARPSMGKTALGMGIVANVAIRHDTPVAVFTMEMSRSELTQRLLSSEALVDARNMRNGRLDGEEWGRLTAASARLDAAPIMIDDTADLTAMELRSKARKLKLRMPKLGLIVIDYLQLMTSGARSENRVQDVSQTSRSLKVLAAELKIPVIALSQLSRQVEQRHDKRPILSDLRESGSIEQDADLVAFVYRDEYYNPEDTDQHGIAEVDLAKHRNGPTGTVKLSFQQRFVRFTDQAAVR